MAEAAEMFEPLSPGELPSALGTKADKPDKAPIVPVPEDAPPMRFRHPVHGEPIKSWPYRDAADRLIGHVCRWDFENANGESDKVILPVTFCEIGDGRRAWCSTGFPSPRPLFGLPDLLAAPAARVLVVEGEKTYDAARKLFPDHVSITWPGGCSGVTQADWEPLKGRSVIVWPDADTPGAKAAQAVVAACHRVGATNVTVVELPADLPRGWDVADLLPADWQPERLRELLNAARPSREPLDAAVRRLAALPRLEYDRHRQDEAKRLDVRVNTLDREVEKARNDDCGEPVGSGRALKLPEPEPWPETVNGAHLLDDLVAVFRRHLALPDGAAEAMALWALHTHAFNAAQVSPRLALTSPEKRCGKTTALTMLSRLVPRPLPVANVTAAAIFRTVEAVRPTLLIDEADTFLRHSDELRGILNSGHDKAMAYVLRTVGENHEPRQFATWTPVAVAAIGRLPNTLEDRSITIAMRRRRADEKVERLRLDRVDDLKILARKAARWALDYTAALVDSDPEVTDTLHDRAADNWRTMLAIADLAGEHWPETARRVAVQLSGDEAGEDGSARVLLLADLRNIFDKRGGDRLASAEIVAALSEREDRPWPEWRNGKPITPRHLAKLLEPFQIVPTTIRTGGKTPKGYRRDQFDDAFARYLDATPSPSATPPQAIETVAHSEFPCATGAPDVADRRLEKTGETGPCGGVADRQGEDDAEAPWETEI